MTTVPRSVSTSLACLRGTAFHRLEKCRDVVKEILKHRTPRQGPKLSSGRIARDAQKATAKRLRDDAKKQGLRGKAKDEFILRAMGIDVTRRTWLKRLLKK